MIGRILRSVLLAILLSFAVGFTIGLVIRAQLEKPTVYIGAVPSSVREASCFSAPDPAVVATGCRLQADAPLARA